MSLPCLCLCATFSTYIYSFKAKALIFTYVVFKAGKVAMIGLCQGSIFLRQNINNHNNHRLKTEIHFVSFVNLCIVLGFLGWKYRECQESRERREYRVKQSLFQTEHLIVLLVCLVLLVLVTGEKQRQLWVLRLRLKFDKNKIDLRVVFDMVRYGIFFLKTAIESARFSGRLPGYMVYFIFEKSKF